MHETSCYRKRLFQLDPTDPQRPRRQAKVHVFDAAKIMAQFDCGDVDTAFLHEIVLARTHEVVLARDLTLMFS